jgi:tripartite ATP-independent transporter DctM subunit
MRYTGVGEDLFDAVYAWMGGMKGGLAIGVIAISALFAAMTGVAAAATLTMTLVALPSMDAHGYSRSISVGSIAAGGLLGLLIPPSVEMILYASISNVSLGKMYLAGIIPGVMIAVIFALYVGIACHIKPSLGPPTKDKIDWTTKIKLLRKIVAPVLLVAAILGGIYTGIATPTEASGIAVVGTLLIGIFRRKLNWKGLSGALFETMKLCGMIFWLIIAASCFTRTIFLAGIGPWLGHFVSQPGMSALAVILVLVFMMFIFGMFMSDTAIVLVMGPVTIPIMAALGVNPLWWAMIFVINMILAWITPPYGTTLFLMKALIPDMTMANVIRSCMPFAACIALGLVICFIFPDVILILPRLLIGG